MGANQHSSKGRDVQYRLRLTTDEKAALDARAAAEGVTLAEMIRAALGLPDAVTKRAAREWEAARQLAYDQGKIVGPHGRAR